MTRTVLLGAVLVLSACVWPAPDRTELVPPSTLPTREPSATPGGCQRAVISKFVELFNARALDALAVAFVDDARTYYQRRGEPTTNEFKEFGRPSIIAMLSVRMADGEVLTYDPATDVLRGRFPDGAERRFATKFVCVGDRLFGLLMISSDPGGR